MQWNFLKESQPTLGAEILIFDRSDAVEDSPQSIPLRTVVGISLSVIDGNRVPELTLRGGFVNSQEGTCEEVIESWLGTPNSQVVWAYF